MADRIDFKALRALAFDDSEEIYDHTRSLSSNLQSIFNDALVIPSPSVQTPILLSYLLVPSALCDVLPILFLQGEKGSGKSTATILASALHATPINAASTTFAALRNTINAARWYDPQYCEGEKNYFLLWDNINRMTLDNEQIYTLLLCGYDRKTDKMSISAGNGENMDFRVFGPKMLSSVHPLFTSSRYDELIRRLLVFHFKQWERFTPEDKAGCPSDFDFTNRLDLSSVDLSILNQKYQEFWLEPVHCERFISIKRTLKSRKKSFKIPEAIDSHKWQISIDILTTGIVTGIFPSLEHGLEALSRYWEWSKLNAVSKWSATHKFLRAAIAELTETARTINDSVGSEVIPIEIKPKDLKLKINQAYQEGALDVIPSPQTISQLMLDLGYKLDRSSEDTMNVWSPIR